MFSASRRDLNAAARRYFLRVPGKVKNAAGGVWGWRLMSIILNEGWGPKEREKTETKEFSCLSGVDFQNCLLFFS